VLVQALVGAAIARTFNGVLRDWQAAPNSPNLGWALAELPRPFANVDDAMRREQALLIRMFPMLQDPDRATAEQWQQVIAQWHQLRQREPDAAQKMLDAVALTAAILPTARAELLKAGWDRAKLDAMQPAQIAAIYCARQFRTSSDDMIKWLGAPHAIAWNRIKEAERRLDTVNRPGKNPLLDFVPAFSRALLSGALVDREIAMLQTIEAIRAYAAANNGQLPRTLDDLGETRAPVDPMTGEAFAYQFEGDRFTLEGVVIAGDNPRNGIRIEGTVKP
jgi:hypothetical protein